MQNKTRDKKITEQRNTPYLEKPKKMLLDLGSEGKGKAKCSNCGKVYSIYGKAKTTDMLGYLKIDNCSNLFKSNPCKGGVS